MCDYSLMTVPNRLAANGEELIVHRFQEGSLGLASAFDLRLSLELRSCRPQGWWSKLKEFWNPTPSTIQAVCIPPGSRLLIRDLPPFLQRESGLQKDSGEAVFTQITAEEHKHRDAVCFRNGAVVLLQKLAEGQRVRVLSVSSEEEQQTLPEYSIVMPVR
jgi:hypothetical protein